MSACSSCETSSHSNSQRTAASQAGNEEHSPERGVDVTSHGYHTWNNVINTDQSTQCENRLRMHKSTNTLTSGQTLEHLPQHSGSFLEQAVAKYYTFKKASLTCFTCVYVILRQIVNTFIL